MYQVTLDRARQYPHGPQPLTFTTAHLSPWIGRPVSLRVRPHGTSSYLPLSDPSLYTELFEVERVAASTNSLLPVHVAARYVGLRRPTPLMSAAEKALSPGRFPA